MEKLFLTLLFWFIPILIRERLLVSLVYNPPAHAVSDICQKSMSGIIKSTYVGLI